MKNFDEWNSIKKIIDGKNEVPNNVLPKITTIGKISYFNERDIVWISCGINIGIESDGKGELYLRPALILRKLNKNHYIVLLCTTTQKEHPYYFKINSENQKLKDTKIILTQVKTIDKKRMIERMVTISENDYKEVKNKFLSIINNSPSPFGEGEANAHK
jgi:mRNA-degrading endonuclease toxin of MazEF toxin-antitoxin module